MARRVHVLVWLVAALLAPPAAACGEGARPVEIEVLLFAGGEGMDFFLQCARQYEKIHPEVRVNLSGDPRMPDKVKIRILEGTFPEVTNIPDGSASWTLIREGYILPMDEYLDKPSWEGDATWRASFLPGSLDKFTYRGKVYGVPLTYWVFAMWYNKAMFEQHGWKPPRTWDELFALCEKVKAAGEAAGKAAGKDAEFAPIAFQGAYPSYANSLVQAGYYHLAGPERFTAMLNLEKGSFDNPEFRQAAALTQRLAKDYFQPGAMGMSHTEAQLQFFLGKTAMIDCGSWLKSEMLGKIPDGFRLGTFNLPVVEGGKGDPTAIQSFNGHYWVMKHSRHPREGADFLRFMTSRKMAGKFCRQCDQPSAVRGASEGNLSADLQDLVGMLNQAKSAYGTVSGEGFPEMDQHWVDMITDLVVTGKATPDQAALMMERAAESVRNRAADPDRVTVRHIWKPVALLGAIGGGAVYIVAAAMLAFRKGRRAGKKDPTAGRMSLRWPSVVLFVGPALLLYTAFVMVPSVQSLGWSTQRWDGLTKMVSVGLLHFRRLLFESDGFWEALKNNLFIMLVIPVFILPLSLFLAACISRAVRGSAFFRVVFFFPNLLGGVAAALLWMHLYNPKGGPINAFLAWAGQAAASCGLTGLGEGLKAFTNFEWLSVDHLYWALVPMSVWGACGFYMVLFLAAMQGIPRELYEAAEIDGASALRQFRDITLPLLQEVIAIATVFLVIGGMKAFEVIWLLTNQRPTTATHVIGTKMVYAMFNEFNVGEASAIAVLLFLMVFFGSAVTLRLMRRERVEF